MSTRNTFYYNKNKNDEIRAGGLLIYKIENNEIFLLLIENRGLYEDIGGCSDINDDSIYETIIREVEDNIFNTLKLFKPLFLKVISSPFSSNFKKRKITVSIIIKGIIFLNFLIN